VVDPPERQAQRGGCIELGRDIGRRAVLVSAHAPRGATAGLPVEENVAFRNATYNRIGVAR
jgi:hypothetical protein